MGQTISDRAFRYLEWCANLAIVVVAIAIVVSLRGGRVPANPPPEVNSKVGQTVPLATLGVRLSDDALLLALKRGCVFCTNSAPFYEKLTKRLAASSMRLVIVTPGEVDEARAYARSLGLPPELVISANLRALGIAGTPTLLHIDRHGQIVHEWRGQLSAERETDVLGAISKYDNQQGG